MITFKKRIAILWTNDSFKDNGGIYHWTRAFLKLAQVEGWQIDILFDKRSSIKGKYAFKELQELGANIIEPKNQVEDHPANYYSFVRGVSGAELVNLQTCLLESLQEHMYDMIIGIPLFVCMIPQMTNLDIPTLWYTHPCGSVTGDYSDFPKTKLIEEFSELFTPKCLIGTQTANNAQIMQARGLNAINLPLPFPDLELLETHTIDKRGVLCCATTEDRKQFDKFLELIVATKLPAKLMTSGTSAKKLEAEFIKAGVTDYEIYHNVQGTVKRDLFASSKIFFTPSYSESFGYAFAEAIPQCHAVAFDYDWTKNFDTNYCHIIPKDKDKKWIKYIEDLYHSNAPLKAGSQDYIIAMHMDAEVKWANLINAPIKLDDKKFTKSFVDTHRNFWIEDLKGLLSTDTTVYDLLSLDELGPLIRRHKAGQATITHTVKGTWFSLDNVPPVEKITTDVFNNLFG